MTEAVSLCTVTTEVQRVLQVRLYGNCGEQGGSGTGFSLSTSVFPCQ